MDEVAGLYRVTEMTTGGEDYTELLAALDSLGLSVTLELDPDGTGIIDYYGTDSTELTWDEDEFVIEGEPTPYGYDGDTITLEDAENLLIFVRTSERELETLEAEAEQAEEEQETQAQGILSHSQSLAQSQKPELSEKPEIAEKPEPPASEPGDIAGDYPATACYHDGREVGVDDELLHLNSDGTGYFILLEKEYPLEWELDGEDFYFLDKGGDEFNGTYRDGVIEGDYYGSYSYVFTREGAAPAERPEATHKLWIKKRRVAK